MQRTVFRLGVLLLAFACASGCQAERNFPDDALPVARFPGTFVPDGRLTEDGWHTTTKTRLERFDGSCSARQPTIFHVAWTAEELLFAFQCEDEDIFSRYRLRDEPLYLEEAVEIFLDPDGDRRDYMEFEVSPRGVLFDAAFSARRRNMNLGFNPQNRVGVSVDGTTDKRDDRDTSWTVELAIPFDDMTGRGRRPPRIGDCWRANIFRLDKSRNSGEASSWKPTAGDFHDLEAFGSLCFVESTGK